MALFFPLFNAMFQFTHPGRGATSGGLTIIYTVNSFNSRTPGGVRRALVSAYSTGVTFKFTHPGRGATPNCRCVLCTNRSFNTRPPGGVRRTSCTRVSRHHIGFNSRTPGGVRPGVTDPWALPACFNSRTPGGVRRYGAKLRIMGRINKRNLRLEVLL